MTARRSWASSTAKRTIRCGPDHSWAAADVGLPPAALAGSDWVLREASSGTRSAFEAAVRGFGLDPRALPVALELPSNEAVRAAVEAGMGATAISATVVAGSLEAGLLRQVPITVPARSFRVLHHRDRTLQPGGGVTPGPCEGNAGLIGCRFAIRPA